MKIADLPKGRYPYKSGSGLVLTVSRTGIRSWSCRFKSRETGRWLTASLGHFPVVTHAQAEEAAIQARRIARPTARITMGQLVREWRRGWNGGPSRIQQVERILCNHILPVIGERLASDITTPDLAKVAQAIPYPVIAADACRILQMVWRHSAIVGTVPVDVARPLTGLIKIPQAVHYRGPTTWAEMQATVQDAARLPDVVRRFMLLLAHTFVRPSELYGIQSSEIEGDVWRIPEGRTKQRREHWVPLTPQTQALLSGTLQWPSMSTLLNAVPGRYTLHGFRAAASTLLHEAGHAEHLIERQLAHRIGSSTSRAYNHATHLNERRAMMEWWSTRLGELLAVKTPVQTQSNPCL